MRNKDKHQRYLDICEQVALGSTCLRRLYGAIIVNGDEIISTGYNGSPRGTKNCIDINFCLRKKLNIAPGEQYEKCRSVHAEQNAIISAARKDMIGATLYLVGLDVQENSSPTLSQYNFPCSICRRMIINAGIVTVIARNPDGSYKETNKNRLIILNDEELGTLLGTENRGELVG